MSNLTALQQSLSYQFNDLDLLKAALTHRSVGRHNNERLEFLGDAMLGTIIAEALFQRFPDAQEGKLTRMRARLVRGETLAVIAHELEFEQLLIVGAGERKTGGRKRSSIRADALEAVLGAVYLDSDFASVKKVVLALFESRLDTVKPTIEKDAKTKLQEALQRQGLPLPDYLIVSQSGKAHDLNFEVQCVLKEPDRYFNATGKSRRVAEQLAAKLALDALK